MNGTRKRGLEPSTTAPRGMTPELQATFDAWPERFRTKVQISTYCWLWIASKGADGYGRYSVTGGSPRVQYAHRVSLALTGVDVPDKMQADHLCRNTSCVRPDHLDVVTGRENIMRSPQSNVSGWCRSGRHEWTEGNILTNTKGVRRCRSCRREREARVPTGNAASDRTHCPAGHPYNEANTCVDANGWRSCKICRRERDRAAYHVKRGLAH